MYIPLPAALASAVDAWAATQQRPNGPNPDGTVDEPAQLRSFARSAGTEQEDAEAALRAAGYISDAQQIAFMAISEDGEVLVELTDRTRMAFPTTP